MRLVTLSIALLLSPLGGCDGLFDSQPEQAPSPVSTQTLAQTILDGYSSCFETCLRQENQENLPTCQLNCQAVAGIDQQKLIKANEEPGAEKVSVAQVNQKMEYLDGCFSSCAEDKKLTRETDRETCYLNCRSAHRISPK